MWKFNSMEGSVVAFDTYFQQTEKGIVFTFSTFYFLTHELVTNYHHCMHRDYLLKNSSRVIPKSTTDYYSAS